MTAVEWLVQQMCGEHTEAWKEEIQQALEMEKQQIIDAKKRAQQDCYVLSTQNVIDELEVVLRQPDVIRSFCHHNGTYTTTKDDLGNEICCKCKKPLAK